MRAECEQEEGYVRTVRMRDESFKLAVTLTEGEARQLVAAIAYGFGNLATSDHIWGPIERAAS